MSFDKFTTERNRICSILFAIGIDKVQFTKDIIPKSFPASIVILESEHGIRPTSSRFTSTSITWSVYLLTNAFEVDDPDMAIYILKEKFREKYQEQFNKDIPAVEYYSSRAEGTRPIKVAKFNLTPSQSLSEQKG